MTYFRDTRRDIALGIARGTAYAFCLTQRTLVPVPAPVTAPSPHHLHTSTSTGHRRARSAQKSGRVNRSTHVTVTASRRGFICVWPSTRSLTRNEATA